MIVKLAERKLLLSEVMRLGVGAIIEFIKSSEEPLHLLINNKPIAVGEAVKVGENFWHSAETNRRCETDHRIHGGRRWQRRPRRLNHFLRICESNFCYCLIVRLNWIFQLCVIGSDQRLFEGGGWQAVSSAG